MATYSISNLSPRLSEKHKRVLELMLEGFTQDQIALELNRSRDSIKHYYGEIRAAFGVVSMYQAVALAVRLGIVSAPASPKV